MNVMIVGGGQVGDYLASLLMERGHKVTLIEQREGRIPTLKRDLPEEAIVLGNGTDPKLLETAGIRNADVLAAVTGADETNLVIATLARYEFGVRRVVARVNNPRNNWLFNPSMGVDLGVNQADLMARVVAEEMSMGDMMTLLKLHRGQFSLVERKVDPLRRHRRQTQGPQAAAGVRAGGRHSRREPHDPPRRYGAGRGRRGAGHRARQPSGSAGQDPRPGRVTRAIT